MKLLSIFSGAGGLDLGLEYAGFESIGCIEMDELCRLSIKENKPDWHILEECGGDVLKLQNKILPNDFNLNQSDLDLIAGGPPCQPFSKAAQWTNNGRNGLSDPRSNAINGFFKIIENFLPKAILIENVQGFVQGKTSAMPLIEEIIESINLRHGTNYQAEIKVLNAADYGVPQNRSRAIIVAFRDGGKFNWPKPKYLNFPIRVGDALYNIVPDEIPELTGKWSQLLASIPEGQNYLWHTVKGGGLPLFGYRTRYWSFLLKLSKELPSWTLPASPGPATGPFHWNNRHLAINERLVLQSFPKNWRLVGTTRDKIKQVGNATPPLFAEVIGRQIAKQICDLKFESYPFLAIKRRIIPTEKETLPDVPNEYLQYIGNHEAHPGTGLGPASRKLVLNPNP